MPLTPQDQLAITQLVYRENRAVDDADADAYVACFTPEAHLVLPSGDLSGRDEIHAHIQSINRPLPVQHWTGNVLIDGEGDRATVRANILTIGRITASENPSVLAMRRIWYSVIRAQGHWVFDRFIVEA